MPPPLAERLPDRTPPPSTDDANGGDASLLRTFAHELRNPLASLRNALQLMRTARDPQVAERALAIVEHQSEHLSQVVEDVVDMATLAAGAGELACAPLTVDALVHAAIEATAGIREQRGQTLAMERLPPALTVHGDEARLVRSLVRVLERASAATPRAGRIRLAVTREDGHVALRIGNGGEAPDPAALQKLFSVQDAGRIATHGASAISLPLVARVLALHGGTASVAADADGTTITLSLPQAADAAPHRILVVDDDRDTADVLCSMLERDGHCARAVYRAGEVLSAALAFAPDTVLLDIGLPDGDGLDVARDLRSRTQFARMRIYALSGYGQPLDHQRSRAAGVDEHLTKPVELDRLRELLRAHGAR